MRNHCCDSMARTLAHSCECHPDPADCPDALVSYSEQFDEYGITVHDGGHSVVNIAFCPWCGTQLPESRRDEWFNVLARMGFDDPWEQEIPAEFAGDAWYRSKAQSSGVNAARAAPGPERWANYNETDEVARYLRTHHTSCFTPDEQVPPSPEELLRLIPELSAAEATLASEGAMEEFEGALADRIDSVMRMCRDRAVLRVLTDHADSISVKRCPECQRIVASPRAQHCLWCGADWHRSE